MAKRTANTSPMYLLCDVDTAGDWSKRWTASTFSTLLIPAAMSSTVVHGRHTRSESESTIWPALFSKDRNSRSSWILPKILSILWSCSSRSLSLFLASLSAATSEAWYLAETDGAFRHPNHPKGRELTDAQEHPVLRGVLGAVPHLAEGLGVALACRPTLLGPDGRIHCPCAGVALRRHSLLGPQHLRPLLGAQTQLRRPHQAALGSAHLGDRAAPLLKILRFG